MTKSQNIEVPQPSLLRTRGRSLWDDLDAMKGQIKESRRMVDELDGKFEAMTRRREEHERQIQSLNGQVERLVQSSESDAYQTKEGDALTDAFLFEHDHRSDTDLYRELYGLEHRKVLELQNSGVDDGGIILVLNAHATMLAQGKTLSDDLKVAFETFLAKVEENWLKPPNEEPTTPLGRAYYTFWTKFKEQSS
ncbi:hypothetical protein JMJ35_006537 [Cladonia borealis]|uniref:Uncharacterized protein n=1 Tax=Cladonia borealis TaxID=184061 RepID=A0AA39QXG5_9LECA|nr:hypothetical protein JMJ35_006537 [Cladonia borealis]